MLVDDVVKQFVVGENRIETCRKVGESVTFRDGAAFYPMRGATFVLNLYVFAGEVVNQRRKKRDVVSQGETRRLTALRSYAFAESAVKGFEKRIVFDVEVRNLGFNVTEHKSPFFRILLQVYILYYNSLFVKAF